MRVLGAEDRVNLDDILLPFEGFQVVGHGHQVGFGGQLVGAVSPVGILERAEAAGAGKGRDLFLDTLEIGCT